MDCINNINTSKLVIRTRHATCIMPPGGVSEKTEASYGPLFQELLHHMNNMHVANADNNNSIVRYRCLIVSSEFNFMGEDY